MAAKGRALSIVLAIVAVFASSSARASIPRPTILDPLPVTDFGAPSEERRPFRDQVQVVDASNDNAELLHRAIDGAFIEPAPVESLSESRVWVSRLERPLFIQPKPLLTHAMQRGSLAAWAEVASDQSVLTPDPLGYRDSSNLYAFAGGDPVNGRDPRGEGKIWDYVKGELEEKAGNAVALGEAVVGFGEGLFRPDRVVAEKLNVAVERAANIVAAHAAGGYDAAKEQYVAEVIDSAKSLPFVRTVVAGLEIPEAAKKSRFQKGLQTGRTAISFAGDVALVYGAVSTIGAVAEASIAESTSFSISPLSDAQLSQASRAGSALRFSGGAHGQLASVAGFEKHHGPADSVSPLSTARGPAFQMLIEDHAFTASWRSSRLAKAYRARQKQLIAEGRFMEAMQMDINDTRLQFGGKYDIAIDEMLDHAATLRPSELLPKSAAAAPRVKAKK